MTLSEHRLASQLEVLSKPTLFRQLWSQEEAQDIAE